MDFHARAAIHDPHQTQRLESVPPLPIAEQLDRKSQADRGARASVAQHSARMTRALPPAEQTQSEQTRTKTVLRNKTGAQPLQLQARISGLKRHISQCLPKVPRRSHILAHKRQVKRGKSPASRSKIHFRRFQPSNVTTTVLPSSSIVRRSRMGPSGLARRLSVVGADELGDLAAIAHFDHFQQTSSSYSLHYHYHYHYHYSPIVKMPYESFAPQQQVEITEVVQDAATNAWMYVLHVQRGNTNTYSSPRGPVEEGFSHEYVISRRFSEFKQLHAALVPVMGDALTPLPSDGLMTLILADNQALLDERRQVLAQIVMDILNHNVARDLPDVLEFLGHESISAKVMAPLSGQCTGSIRKTSCPAWTALNGACRASVMSS